MAKPLAAAAIVAFCFLPLIAQASSPGAVNEFIRDIIKRILFLVLLAFLCMLATAWLPASGLVTVIRLALGLFLALGVLMLVVGSWALSQ